MRIEPGAHLGPYEVVSAIGAGGMGEVWRARDTRLHRDVAIKVLPREFAADAHLHARLEREAQVVVPGRESAEGPFFSPDSRSVGFAVGVSGLKGNLPPELRRVSVDGGLPQTICPLDDFFGAAWSGDDTIYFSGQSGKDSGRSPRAAALRSR